MPSTKRGAPAGYRRIVRPRAHLDCRRGLQTALWILAWAYRLTAPLPDLRCGRLDRSHISAGFIQPVPALWAGQQVLFERRHFGLGKRSHMVTFEVVFADVRHKITVPYFSVK